MSSLVIHRKASSVDFILKISAEKLSVSAERNFLIFAEKGCFAKKDQMSGENKAYF